MASSQGEGAVGRPTPNSIWIQEIDFSCCILSLATPPIPKPNSSQRSLYIQSEGTGPPPCSPLLWHWLREMPKDQGS